MSSTSELLRAAAGIIPDLGTRRSLLKFADEIDSHDAEQAPKPKPVEEMMWTECADELRAFGIKFATQQTLQWPAMGQLIEDMIARGARPSIGRGGVTFVGDEDASHVLIPADWPNLPLTVARAAVNYLRKHPK